MTVGELGVWAGKNPDGTRRRISKTIRARSRREADKATARLAVDVENEETEHFNTFMGYEPIPMSTVIEDHFAAKAVGWSERTKKNMRGLVDKERQHDRPVAFFDKPDRLTVSGVHRGEQRKSYYRRRDELIPEHRTAPVGDSIRRRRRERAGASRPVRPAARPRATPVCVVCVRAWRVVR